MFHKQLMPSQWIKCLIIFSVFAFSSVFGKIALTISKKIPLWFISSTSEHFQWHCNNNFNWYPIFCRSSLQVPHFANFQLPTASSGVILLESCRRGIRQRSSLYQLKKSSGWIFRIRCVALSLKFKGQPVAASVCVRGDRRARFPTLSPSENQ